MANKNYRMYVLCSNCFCWETFSIPKGVGAKQIVDKRKCAFCGCLYGPDAMPINKQQMEETKKAMSEMLLRIWGN